MERQKPPEGTREGGVPIEVPVAARVPAPNQAMLSALARIEEIQKGMCPAENARSLDDLREARSGGMYGNRPDK
jgi:hypothetical protein